MKSRKEQHNEEKSSSVVLSIALMCFSGGAAFVNGNAAYITLNRDSAEYAIVKGTLNSNASWGSRPRVSFDYEGEETEQQSHPQKKQAASVNLRNTHISDFMYFQHIPSR